MCDHSFGLAKWRFAHIKGNEPIRTVWSSRAVSDGTLLELMFTHRSIEMRQRRLCVRTQSITDTMVQ